MSKQVVDLPKLKTEFQLDPKPDVNPSYPHFWTTVQLPQWTSYLGWPVLITLSVNLNGQSGPQGYFLADLDLFRVDLGGLLRDASISSAYVWESNLLKKAQMTIIGIMARQVPSIRVECRYKTVGQGTIPSEGPWWGVLVECDISTTSMAPLPSVKVAPVTFATSQGDGDRHEEPATATSPL